MDEIQKTVPAVSVNEEAAPAVTANEEDVPAVSADEETVSADEEAVPAVSAKEVDIMRKVATISLNQDGKINIAIEKADFLNPIRDTIEAYARCPDDQFRASKVVAHCAWLSAAQKQFPCRSQGVLPCPQYNPCPGLVAGPNPCPELGIGPDPYRGLGIGPNTTVAFTEADIRTLYDNGILNDQDFTVEQLNIIKSIRV